MKLILPSSIAAFVEPRLPEFAPGCQVIHIDDKGNPDSDPSQADAFFRWWLPNPVFTRVLGEAPHIRWVHTPSAGVDHILIPEVTENNITLTNSAGAHAVPIAEFVMMYMLCHIKHTRSLMALHPENAWDFENRQDLNELYGKTVLVIGLGSIGREIARRASAFGMRVTGSRRTPRPMEDVAQVVGADEWRVLLPEADYVVVAAPLTEQTRAMVDAAALAQMKPGAYLINIARGQIIDTDALIEALHSGHLAGAGLDVTPEEPLPAQHPLWKAPNVWITPHISYSSPHTRERMFDIFLENARRYVSGEPLLNVVDMQAGY